MRRLNHAYSVLIIAFCFFICVGRTVSADPVYDLHRAAILSTAAEAALATSSFLKDRNPGKSVKGDWSITFSTRNWVLTLKGGGGSESYNYTVAGFLWGDDNEDWLITYSGLGSIGSEPIFISGKALWRYDVALADHVGMSFEHTTKFGENSKWGWMRGSEIVFGGTLGAVGGVIVVAGTPAAIILGIGGAVGGAASAVTLSDVAKEFFETPNPPPPPAVPKPPVFPKSNEKISPGKDRIIIAISRETIGGTGPGEELALSGSYKVGTGTGVIFER
jgi:hypothetical protein